MLLWSNHLQNPGRAQDYMARLGYTDIQMEGEYTYTCRRGREFPFHAVAANGQHVHGEVCVDLLGYWLTSWPDRNGQ